MQVTLNLEQTREVERFYNSEACKLLLQACFSEIDLELDNLREALLDGPELDRDKYYMRRDALDAQKAAVVLFETKLHTASMWLKAKEQHESETFKEQFIN